MTGEPRGAAKSFYEGRLREARAAARDRVMRVAGVEVPKCPCDCDESAFTWLALLDAQETLSRMSETADRFQEFLRPGVIERQTRPQAVDMLRNVIHGAWRGGDS